MITYKRGELLFMALLSCLKHKGQTKFKYEIPGDDLDDDHLSKLIVYGISRFKKEKPYLFPDLNPKGKPGPKVKYTPEEMLALTIFCSFRLHRSCRKMESFLDDKNEACIYITNNKFPRKSKINQFKNRYEYLIDECLKYTVEFSELYGIVDFETVVLDSTNFEAYVNDFRRLSNDQIDYLIDLIENHGSRKGKNTLWKQLKAYFYDRKLPEKLVKWIDEIYATLNKYGRELLIIALKSKKTQKEVLDFLYELKEQCDGKTYVNLTDPDCRRIKLKDGRIRFGYTVQTLRDAKTGIILMQNVVQDENDVNQLIPAIDYIYKTYCKLPKYILADNGYYKIEAIEYAIKKGVTPVVPDRSDSMKNKGTKDNDPFDKSHMDFDPIKKIYRCFNMEKLTKHGTRMIKGILHDVFRTDKCKNCQFKQECTNGKDYREVVNPACQAFYDRKEFFLSSDGEKLYKLRAVLGENVFSDLKEHQEFKQSKRRGLRKVDIDLKIEALVANFKNIAKHLHLTFIS